MFSKCITYLTLIGFINASCVAPLQASLSVLEQNEQGAYVVRGYHLDQDQDFMAHGKPIGSWHLKNGQGVFQGFDEHHFTFETLPPLFSLAIQLNGSLTFLERVTCQQFISVQTLSKVSFFNGFIVDAPTGGSFLKDGHYHIHAQSHASSLILQNTKDFFIHQGAHLMTDQTMTEGVNASFRNHGTFSSHRTHLNIIEFTNGVNGKLDVGELFQGSFTTFQNDGETVVKGLAFIQTHRGRITGNFKARGAFIKFDQDLLLPKTSRFEIQEHLHLSGQRNIQIHGDIQLKFNLNGPKAIFSTEIQNELKKIKPGIFINAKENLIKTGPVIAHQGSIHYLAGKKFEATVGVTRSGFFEKNAIQIQAQIAQLEDRMHSFHDLQLKANSAILLGKRDIQDTFRLNVDQLEQKSGDITQAGSISQIASSKITLGGKITADDSHLQAPQIVHEAHSDLRIENVSLEKAETITFEKGSQTKATHQDISASRYIWNQGHIKASQSYRGDGGLFHFNMYGGRISAPKIDVFADLLSLNFLGNIRAQETEINSLLHANLLGWIRGQEHLRMNAPLGHFAFGIQQSQNYGANSLLNFNMGLNLTDVPVFLSSKNSSQYGGENALRVVQKSLTLASFVATNPAALTTIASTQVLLGAYGLSRNLLAFYRDLDLNELKGWRPSHLSQKAGKIIGLAHSAQQLHASAQNAFDPNPSTEAFSERLQSYGKSLFNSSQTLISLWEINRGLNIYGNNTHYALWYDNSSKTFALNTTIKALTARDSGLTCGLNYRLITTEKAVLKGEIEMWHALHITSSQGQIVQEDGRLSGKSVGLKGTAGVDQRAIIQGVDGVKLLSEKGAVTQSFKANLASEHAQIRAQKDITLAGQNQIEEHLDAQTPENITFSSTADFQGGDMNLDGINVTLEAGSVVNGKQITVEAAKKVTLDGAMQNQDLSVRAQGDITQGGRIESENSAKLFSLGSIAQLPEVKTSAKTLELKAGHDITLAGLNHISEWLDAQTPEKMKVAPTAVITGGDVTLEAGDNLTCAPGSRIDVQTFDAISDGPLGLGGNIRGSKYINLRTHGDDLVLDPFASFSGDNIFLESEGTLRIPEQVRIQGKNLSLSGYEIFDIPSLMSQTGRYGNFNIQDTLQVKTDEPVSFLASATSKSNNFILKVPGISLNNGVHLHAPGILSLDATSAGNFSMGYGKVSSGIFTDIHGASIESCGKKSTVPGGSPHTKNFVQSVTYERSQFSGGSGVPYTYIDPETGVEENRTMGLRLRSESNIYGQSTFFGATGDVLLQAQRDIRNYGAQQLVLTYYHKDEGKTRTEREYRWDTEFFPGSIASTHGKVLIDSMGGTFQQYAGSIESAQGIDLYAPQGIETPALKGFKGTLFDHEFDGFWQNLTTPFHGSTGTRNKVIAETISEIHYSGPVRHVSKAGDIIMPGLVLKAPNSTVTFTGRKVVFDRPLLEKSKTSTEWKWSFGFTPFESITNPAKALDVAKDSLHAIRNVAYMDALKGASPSIRLSLDHITTQKVSTTVGPGHILAGNLKINSSQEFHQGNAYDITVLNDAEIQSPLWTQTGADLPFSHKRSTLGSHINLTLKGVSGGIHWDQSKTNGTKHLMSHFNAHSLSGNIDVLQQQNGLINVKQSDVHIEKFDSKTEQNESKTKTMGGSVSVGVTYAGKPTLDVSLNGKLPGGIQTRTNPKENSGLYVGKALSGFEVGSASLVGSKLSIDENHGKVGPIDTQKLPREKKQEGFTFGIDLSTSGSNNITIGYRNQGHQLSTTLNPAIDETSLFHSIGTVSYSHNKVNITVPLATGINSNAFQQLHSDVTWAKDKAVEGLRQIWSVNSPVIQEELKETEVLMYFNRSDLSQEFTAPFSEYRLFSAQESSTNHPWFDPEMIPASAVHPILEADHLSHLKGSGLRFKVLWPTSNRAVVLEHPLQFQNSQYRRQPFSPENVSWHQNPAEPLFKNLFIGRNYEKLTKPVKLLGSEFGYVLNENQGYRAFFLLEDPVLCHTAMDALEKIKNANSPLIQIAAEGLHHKELPILFMNKGTLSKDVLGYHYLLPNTNIIQVAALNLPPAYPAHITLAHELMHYVVDIRSGDAILPKTYIEGLRKAYGRAYAHSASLNKGNWGGDNLRGPWNYFERTFKENLKIYLPEDQKALLFKNAKDAMIEGRSPLTIADYWKNGDIRSYIEKAIIAGDEAFLSEIPSFITQMDFRQNYFGENLGVSMAPEVYDVLLDYFHHNPQPPKKTPDTSIEILPFRISIENGHSAGVPFNKAPIPIDWSSYMKNQKTLGEYAPLVFNSEYNLPAHMYPQKPNVLKTVTNWLPLADLGLHVACEKYIDKHDWSDSFARGTVRTGVDTIGYGITYGGLSYMAGGPAAWTFAGLSFAGEFIPDHKTYELLPHLENAHRSAQDGHWLESLNHKQEADRIADEMVVKGILTATRKGCEWGMDKIDESFPTLIPNMSTYFYGVGADIKNEGKRMINLWHQLGGKVPIYDVKTDQQLQRDKDGFYEQKVREKTLERRLHDLEGRMNSLHDQIRRNSLMIQKQLN